MLNRPRTITFLIALLVAGVGIASHFVSIPFVTPNNFWFISGGFVLLLLGNIFKGL